MVAERIVSDLVWGGQDEGMVFSYLKSRVTEEDSEIQKGCDADGDGDDRVSWR
jgi:hypothetical protein